MTCYTSVPPVSGFDVPLDGLDVPLAVHILCPFFAH